MTWRSGLANVALAVLVATEIVANPTPADRCRAFMKANSDLVCMALPDARALDIKISTLEHDLTVARVGTSHFGLGCTVGPYIGGAVDQNLGWHWTGGPVALDCGLNLRFSGPWWHRK